MGREIEIKIPLTDVEYKRIFDFVNGNTDFDGVSICGSKAEHLLKSDEYYSRYESREESKKAGEPQVIRIRCENCSENWKGVAPVTDKTSAQPNERSFFCIKRKSVENGIELNREDETFVENADVIRDLLNLSGYHKFFEKKKDALSVHCKSDVLEGADFHLELEIVNGFKYIEVEVTDGEVSADKVRGALGKFMEKFGLDTAQRDSRSWMEIIQGCAK